MNFTKSILEKSFAKKPLTIFFAFLLLLSNNTLAGAQGSGAANPNQQFINFKDGSPGVVGELNITTESMSEDSGNILITGNLKYDFPPQPKSITITVTNVDGKGTFKGFTASGTSSTPDNISMLLTNIPLDKSTKSKTLATKDKFLITSKVDKGVDFFFAGNSTYLGFNAFSALPQNTVTPPDPLLVQTPLTSGKSVTQSIIVTDSKLISAGTAKTKASAAVDFAALTLLPSNHYTPIYVGLARFDGEKVLDYTVGEWKEIQDPDAPRNDGMVLGASKHTFTVEKGTSYLVKAWGDTKSTTKPDEGEYLGTFNINADYLFGKKVSNTAPGLRPVDQSKIDDIWGSITGTFSPSQIEFFKVGGTEGLVAGSDKAYIFLANIPGLANTTKLGVDKKTLYPAFDPTIPGSFSKYISTFINMIYGFIALVAVINIIHYGLKLMANAAVPSIKKESTEMISNSFIALGIALGSYLLLNTINPNLTNWGIGLNRVEVSGESLVFIQTSEGNQARLSEQDAAEEKAAPGSTKKFKRTTYYDSIKTWVAASKTNIPHCLIQVSILRESRGIPGLIGHDENVRSSGIKSRRDFFADGKTFLGKPVTGNYADKVYNDDNTGKEPPNKNAADLGLDWRYSHSVGLFGITFFPKGSKYGDYSKGIYMPIAKKTVFPKDILYNQQTDVDAYTEMMKKVYDTCNQNVLGTYKYLSSGSCTGSNAFTNVEAPLRADLYNQCVAQDK